MMEIEAVVLTLVVNVLLITLLELIIIKRALLAS